MEIVLKCTVIQSAVIVRDNLNTLPRSEIFILNNNNAKGFANGGNCIIQNEHVSFLFTGKKVQYVRNVL